MGESIFNPRLQKGFFIKLLLFIKKFFINIIADDDDDHSVYLNIVWTLSQLETFLWIVVLNFKSYL